MDTPFSRQLAFTAEQAAINSAIPVSVAEDDFPPVTLGELLRRQQLVEDAEGAAAAAEDVAITS